MRVIHITVKTEVDAETAHCVCTFLCYLNSNSNKIYLSICQQIDKSGIGSTSQPWIQDMRTAVRECPKSLCCSRQLQRSSTCDSLYVHGFCVLPSTVCLAVANPYQRRSRIQQRTSQSIIQQHISHAWIRILDVCFEAQHTHCRPAQETKISSCEQNPGLHSKNCEVSVTCSSRHVFRFRPTPSQLKFKLTAHRKRNKFNSRPRIHLKTKRFVVPTGMVTRSAPRVTRA